MLLKISIILTKEQVAQCRATINAAEWVDDRITIGAQPGQVKYNMQLPESSLVARQIGTLIQSALSANTLFFSAALPLKVFPPLLNRYVDSQTFGNHVNNTVRRLHSAAFRIRNDFPCTSLPTESGGYDGGELVVDDVFGEHHVKSIAGDTVLYLSGSLHRVTSVVRGTRACLLFWLQSMVRSDVYRTLLFRMNTELQQLVGLPRQDDLPAITLMGTYHNLLWEWVNV